MNETTLRNTIVAIFRYLKRYDENINDLRLEIAALRNVLDRESCGKYSAAVVDEIEKLKGQVGGAMSAQNSRLDQAIQQIMDGRGL